MPYTHGFFGRLYLVKLILTTTILVCMKIQEEIDVKSYGENVTMARKISKNISVFEFECQAPLRFFERCAKCPRFEDDCPDLSMGIEILSRKKKISYGHYESEDTIHVSEFNCLTPLKYIEKTRMKCVQGGRCRDEGLLLALLNGKKNLVYSYKEVTEISLIRSRRRKKAVMDATAEAQAAGF